MNQELVRWMHDSRWSAVPAETREYVRWEYGRNAEHALGALARAGRVASAKRAAMRSRWIVRVRARLSAAITGSFARAGPVR